MTAGVKFWCMLVPATTQTICICEWSWRPGNDSTQVAHLGASSVARCAWNVCILVRTECCSNSGSCDWTAARRSVCLSLSQCSQASLSSGLSVASLSRWWVLICCCKRVSLSWEASAASLSLLTRKHLSFLRSSSSAPSSIPCPPLSESLFPLFVSLGGTTAFLRSSSSAPSSIPCPPPSESFFPLFGSLGGTMDPVPFPPTP